MTSQLSSKSQQLTLLQLQTADYDSIVNMSKVHATRNTKTKNGGRGEIEVDAEVNDVKCGTCNKIGVELECEVCLRWFHPKCVNVSDSKLRELKKHEFHWYCSNCDVAAVEIHIKMQSLQFENTDLKNKVKNLTTKVNKLQENNQTLLQEVDLKVATKFADEVSSFKDELKQEILDEVRAAREADPEVVDVDDDEDESAPGRPWNDVGRRRHTPTPNLRKIIHEEMTERQQIDLIKKNLVMAGVTESQSEEGDLQSVVDIIKNNLDIDADIEKVTRIGKTPGDGTPRLLKLFMRTQENRKSILQNAKKLRQSEDDDVKAKVFINPDMTTKQQLEAKNLRLQRNKLREENPQKTYRIKRGVVVEVQTED